MATITKPGEALAMRLRFYFPYSSDVAETCSLLARHGVTYERIQEVWCNVDMSERQWMVEYYEEKESRLEKRISALVDSLPEATDPTTGERFRFRIQFDGDPRGYTTRLIGPNNREVGIA